MSHLGEASARLLRRLLERDEELATKTRQMGCQRCGGPLHVADYPRKPRGRLGDLEEAYSKRLSFCCGHCRRRATPPSVRFLGRKVYVSQLVVVASVILQELAVVAGRDVCGVPRRTVKRWVSWWQHTFCQTSLWQSARALLMPPVDSGELPRSLLERFDGPAPVAQMLAFVTPVTTESARYVRDDIAHAQDGAWRARRWC